MNRNRTSLTVVLAVGVLAAAGAAALVAADRNGGGGRTTRTGAAAAQPPSGHLYVLDSAQRAKTSQVIDLDLSTRKAVRSYAAGHMPDAALSPHGDRLYVTSSTWDTAGETWKSTLQTYDTRSGALVGTAGNPDDLIYTGSSYPSRMKVSPSGNWIYILKDHQTVASDDYYMAVFDTVRNQFLSHQVLLHGCRDGLFFPTAQELTVDVACTDTQTVTEITLDPTDTSATETRLPLSTQSQPRVRFGAGLVDPGSGRLAFITRDWQGVVVDRATKSVRRIAFNAPADRWVRMQRALVAENQAAVFFATGRLSALKSGSDEFDQIVKADTNRLAARAMLRTRTPFYSMSLSADGNTIYTVSPQTATITAIDARSLREIDRMTAIGRSPVFALASAQ